MGSTARSALRTAIVGAGLMGRWHAYYAVRSGAEVTAIVDRDPRAAAALQNRYPGAKCYVDLKDCLDSIGVDVVHVCTPVETHLSLAELAMQAGKHVLVEKPTAASSGEVHRLVDLAARNHLNICSVHQFPFQRGMQRFQRSKDRLGDLILLTFTAFSSGGEGRSKAARREVLFEILPHPFSLCRVLFGEQLLGFSWTLLTFTDDELEVWGRLRETYLSIRISLRGRPPRNDLVVIGTKGTAHVDFFHGFSFFEILAATRTGKLLLPFYSGCLLLLTAGLNLIRRIVNFEPAYPGLDRLIAEFYQSITQNRAAPVSEREMVDVAVLMDRVRALVPREDPQNLSSRHPST